MESGSSSSCPAFLPPANNKIFSISDKEQLCREYLDYIAKTLYDDDSFSLITEPLKCLDPDDRSTVEPFLLKYSGCRIVKDILAQNWHPGDVPGEEIYGARVFELYSIKIMKIDLRRFFSTIHMTSMSTSYLPLIIYHQPQPGNDELIPLNKPLPLKNLFRPPNPMAVVSIGLSNPDTGGWCFNYIPPRSGVIEYGRFVDEVKDEITDSEAVISYELMESAAIAQLVFKLFDVEEERPIRVFGNGTTISATNDGDQFTNRLILSFPNGDERQMMSGKEVSVHRSTFAVPLGSNLQVSAQLMCSAGKEGPFVMEGCLIFQVPNKVCSVEQRITVGCVQLSVNVSWTNCLWV